MSTLAKIKNTGKHVTVFKVESVPMGVTVEPTIALLQSGDRLNLTLTYSPKEESKIRDKITFKVRGYTKLLELPIEGQSVLPDVRIIEEELNFGVVELGNRVYQPLTIENRSEVKVSMTIDLAWDKVLTQVSDRVGEQGAALHPPHQGRREQRRRRGGE